MVNNFTKIIIASTLILIPQASGEYKAINYNKNFQYRMIKAIACVESNSGKNINHKQLPIKSIHQGTKAYGKYALTPILIKETAQIDKNIDKLYPDLRAMNIHKINNYMKSNPNLENLIATSHLRRLIKLFGNNPKAIGHAWLNGSQSTKNALKSGKSLKDHWHVRKILSALKDQQSL